MDRGQEEFLRYWFQGLVSGLEQVDENAQTKILDACGQACGQSYTVQVFREARNTTVSMAEFLLKLGEKFPEAAYRYENKNTIRVVYDFCACDLVRNGWVTSPLMCQCSASNLKHNFEQSIQKTIAVVLKRSILAGAEQCEFEVTILD